MEKDFTEIKTDNLIIKKFEMEMAEAVHEISLDEDNRKFLPDEVFETTEDARNAIEFLISRYDSTSGPFVYPIISLKENQNIGHVQLAKLENEKWEIGFHVGEKFAGKGYATEAVKAFLPEVCQKLSLKEVFGICLKENSASLRVLEKCGFKIVSCDAGNYQGKDLEIVTSVWKMNRTDSSAQ